MKLNRRQLRKIIRESLIINEAKDQFQLPEQEKDKLIAGIDWKTCDLPDAAAWQGYTNTIYGWSKKKGKSTEVAKQQFEGAVTVPIYWEALVLTADTWVKKEARKLETHDWWHYNSGYKKPGGYVEFYNKHAGGRDMHSKEFNKLFLDTFLNAYKEGMLGSKGNPAIQARASDAHMKVERANMENYLDKTIQFYIEKGCIPPEFNGWFSDNRIQ